MIVGSLSYIDRLMLFFLSISLYPHIFGDRRRRSYREVRRGGGGGGSIEGGAAGWQRGGCMCD